MSETTVTANQPNLATAVSAIMANPRIKQAIVIIMGDDDEIVEFKGHFYDNAVLMNSIVKDLKGTVYGQLFDERPDPLP